MIALSAVSFIRFAATRAGPGGPERVDSRIERGVRTHEGLERHGAGDVGQAGQARASST